MLLLRATQTVDGQQSWSVSCLLLVHSKVSTEIEKKAFRNCNNDLRAHFILVESNTIKKELVLCIFLVAFLKIYFVAF